MDRIYIGIDPGSKGGIAILTANGKLDDVKVYDCFEIANILNDVKNQYTNCTLMCTLEKVHSMPRDGGKQAFKFGENYGFVKGTLTALKIPFQEVTPQTWKKEYLLLNTEKTESIKRCKELFPNVNLLPTERCKKESDGMAESILICEYGRRHF